MPVCPGITRSGARCTVVVKGSQTYCYQHDPAHAEERRRNAARAGRGGPSREIRELKDKLAALYADVLAGGADRADAAVCNQIINTRLRALALERDIRETQELAERVERLEHTEDQEGRRGWGA